MQVPPIFPQNSAHTLFLSVSTLSSCVNSLRHNAWLHNRTPLSSICQSSGLLGVDFSTKTLLVSEKAVAVVDHHKCMSWWSRSENRHINNAMCRVGFKCFDQFRSMLHLHVIGAEFHSNIWVLSKVLRRTGQTQGKEKVTL